MYQNEGVYAAGFAPDGKEFIIRPATSFQTSGDSMNRETEINTGRVLLSGLQLGVNYHDFESVEQGLCNSTLQIGKYCAQLGRVSEDGNGW